MLWLRGFVRKKVVCFIDDDEGELKRFQEAMRDQPSKADPFTCVTATTYQDCMSKLSTMKLKPDLWVLDLFFGERPATEEEKEEMAGRFANLEQHLADFRKYLAGINQGSKMGLDLLRTCRENHRAPAIMFTRKGTLQDSIDCYEAGATAVLKKPMPPAFTGTRDHKNALLDRAMAEQAVYLRGKFVDAITANSFWQKHRGITFFVLGVIFTAISNMLANHFAGPALKNLLSGLGLAFGC
jgi:CheY-like chemotaxis protein